MNKRAFLKVVCFFALMVSVLLFAKVSTAQAAVKLTRKEKNLYVGETYKLKLKSATASKVTFKSSNTDVATVSKKGTITAKKAGTVTITATYKKKKYNCTVTVRDLDKTRDNLHNLLAIDMNGNEIDISTFTDYNITMINMWEPWCGPCRGEMPGLEELYEKYHKYGLNIIGVAGDDASSVQSILDMYGITYPIINDETLSFVLNGTGYIPCTIFVDKYGYLIYDEPVVGGKSADSWYSDYISAYLDK